MTSPVWVITGTSSGFGRQLALHAMGQGHRVVATARKLERVADLAAAGAYALALDVTAPLAELEAVAREVFAQFGRVDYLVNAAGYALVGAVEEVAPAELEAVFRTNVFGAFNMTHAFLAAGMRTQPFLEATGGQQRGAVVQFGSLASWCGSAGGSVYNMTKAACSSLAESLRPELAPFGLASTVVEPGFFRTAFLSPRSRVLAAKEEPAYAGTAGGQMREFLAQMDGKQRGDLHKGCRVVFEMLTKTGVAAGAAAGPEGVPPRIVLGSDCEELIREECRATVALLDQWKGVAASADGE